MLSQRHQRQQHQILHYYCRQRLLHRRHRHPLGVLLHLKIRYHHYFLVQLYLDLFGCTDYMGLRRRQNHHFVQHIAHHRRHHLLMLWKKIRN
jgi:hypothetical protein